MTNVYFAGTEKGPYRSVEAEFSEQPPRLTPAAITATDKKPVSRVLKRVLKLQNKKRRDSPFDRNQIFSLNS